MVLTCNGRRRFTASYDFYFDFLQLYLGIELYKKNWKKVTAHVGTRISAQVRSHAQKVLKDYSPNYQPGESSIGDDDSNSYDDDEEDISV